MMNLSAQIPFFTAFRRTRFSAGLKAAVVLTVLLLAGSYTAAAQPLTITTTVLPRATAGTEYSATLTATGGSQPYTWTANSSLPPGLTLSSAGAVTGTPTSTGEFEFSVTVRDAFLTTASARISLVVQTAQLAITTMPPLFTGVVGEPYVQVFTATGGVTPYTWSVVSGDTGDLTLDPATGALQGVPQSAGTLSFVIMVRDHAGASSSRAFEITVNPPSLTIVTGSTLPDGAVDVAYSQKFSAVGGAPPYTWTMTAGSVPGLTLSGDVLSGTPMTAGTFHFTLRVADSGDLTATKSFTLTVAPAALRITTPSPLPDALLGSAYSQQITAEGGMPPYRWSATGLPQGLSIDTDSGLISGTAESAGEFSFTIRVLDSVQSSATDLFSVKVALPPVPPATVTGLPAVADPASQYSLQVSIASSYAVDISGQALLSFSPDSGGGDKTIQFASGGTTANFTIPAGSTEAVSDVPLALQTGTVAGEITVSLRLHAGGQDITPSPAPETRTRIDRAAPVIHSVRVERESGRLSILVTGYSTAREVTKATYHFTASPGETLQVSEVTTPVETFFNTWFQNPTSSDFGSQFVLTQPFKIDGNVNGVIPQSVTLTNRLGSVTFEIK